MINFPPLSSNQLLIKLFVVIVLLHLFLSLNITYSSSVIASEWYSDFHAASIRDVNKDQCNQFVNSFEKSRRAEAISNIKMTYFGIIPYWIRNVFYLAYILIIGLILLRSNRMFRPVAAAFMILFLSGCSTYNQVYYVGSADGKTSKQDQFFIYENDTIKVSYIFWGANGAMIFNVYNKLDKPIYVDWKKSSFVGKGVKGSYYEERTRSTSNSVAMSKYAGFGSLLALNMNGIEVKEERITFVPPHSNITKSSGYQLVYGYLKLKKSELRDTVIDGKSCYQTAFDKSMGITFRNYLTYSFKESFDQEYSVDNTFYLSKVVVMNSSQFMGSQIYKPLSNNIIWQHPYKSADKFYYPTSLKMNQFVSK